MLSFFVLFLVGIEIKFLIPTSFSISSTDLILTSDITYIDIYIIVNIKPIETNIIISLKWFTLYDAPSSVAASAI